MNRPINHPIFRDTDEVEAFVSRAIEAGMHSDCNCCNRPMPNKISFEGMYDICEDCWSNNKNRAILDIQAIYKDAEDVIPYTKINDFFKGYWED